MTTYDNTNSGLLMKNDRKETDKHPDYRGSINVNGQDFWLSAWIKDGREGTKLAGQKYMSPSVQPKESQAPSVESPRATTGQLLDKMDDNLPF